MRIEREKEKKKNLQGIGVMNISFKKFKRFLKRPSHGRRTATYVHIISSYSPRLLSNQNRTVCTLLFRSKDNNNFHALFFSLSIGVGVINSIM